ncbi:hypothetical protein LUZ60_016796 [Juncus effusus]|nr:hypothetical protein LUZ60_016796 [Juncus effusus]
MVTTDPQTRETQIAKRPLGIRIIERIKGSELSFKSYQAIVLITTFFAYASYHATRKTTSIVKSVLDPKTTSLTSTHYYSNSFFLTLTGNKSNKPGLNDGWAPFDSSNGTAMLGNIDVAFLAIYAFGMYFAGHLGDRVNLKNLLTIGMVGTGIFTAFFGTAYWLDIHNFYYFLGVQMIAGLFQATGWPSVVAVVGNWFGKSKRGLIMGIWNAHTSVGNITGSLIASYLLRFGWGWSFVVPGLIIALFGLLVFLFLPVSPVLVGVREEEERESESFGEKNNGVLEPLLERGESSEEKPVGFMEAWRIPGVAPFALCLFFSKLVAYTFLYWLPFYISHTAINGEYLSDSTAGTLSTIFDLGGVLGGILAGHISDKINARALTAATFTYLAIPSLYFYRSYGGLSLTHNVLLMFLTGMLVNGPYALITTAVSTDLGTHKSLNGNSRALATVTAIIDGTGSVGAAVGPLVTGYVSAKSWSAVFTMLMSAALIAGLLLSRLVIAEISTKIEARRKNLSDLPVSGMVEP